METNNNKSKRHAREYRQFIRAAADVAGTSFPVKIVEGGQAPSFEGDGCHYETRGGERISHPGAYKKKGFSNMVYMSSTLCVQVGASWLAARSITAEMVA